MGAALVSKFSEAEAKELTEELKADYGALQVKIAAAWRGRIWVALGYESWQDYLDYEFRDISLRPPKELEEQVISELRAAGMSTRGIAAATSMSKDTIARRLESGTVSNETVDRIVGLDGRTRRASNPHPSPPSEPEIVDAEFVDVAGEESAGEDRLASDLGIEPIPVDMSGRAPIGREHVNRLINELHAGGSAPLPMVKKKAKSLELAFGSGQLDAQDLDGERLEDLGRDVADAVGVLSDLLTELSATRPAGWAAALEHPDTVGSVRKSLTNLQLVATRVGSGGAAAIGGAR